MSIPSGLPRHAEILFSVRAFFSIHITSLYADFLIDSWQTTLRFGLNHAIHAAKNMLLGKVHLLEFPSYLT